MIAFLLTALFGGVLEVLGAAFNMNWAVSMGIIFVIVGSFGAMICYEKLKARISRIERRLDRKDKTDESKITDKQ